MFGRLSSHVTLPRGRSTLRKPLFVGGSSGLAGRIGCSTVVYWARGSVAPVSKKCRHRLSPPPPRPRACIPRCVSRRKCSSSSPSHQKKNEQRYVARSYSVSIPKALRSTFCMGGLNMVGGEDAASCFFIALCPSHASSPVSSSLRGVMSTSLCFHLCTRSHGAG